jgi:hypothetical protein
MYHSTLKGPLVSYNEKKSSEYVRRCIKAMVIEKIGHFLSIVYFLVGWYGSAVSLSLLPLSDVICCIHW